MAAPLLACGAVVGEAIWGGTATDTNGLMLTVVARLRLGLEEARLVVAGRVAGHDENKTLACSRPTSICPVCPSGACNKYLRTSTPAKGSEAKYCGFLRGRVLDSDRDTPESLGSIKHIVTTVAAHGNLVQNAGKTGLCG